MAKLNPTILLLITISMMMVIEIAMGKEDDDQKPKKKTFTCMHQKDKDLYFGICFKEGVEKFGCKKKSDDWISANQDFTTPDAMENIYSCDPNYSIHKCCGGDDDVKDKRDICADPDEEKKKKDKKKKKKKESGKKPPNTDEDLDQTGKEG
ncbi:expressed protein [Phakopsora pachyrhizi]|uniref:Expressed protein n=1 Tax=Phakopsora pachyrhizi TaxID=170000 RepID=A0AAV0ASG4_PHAPC|nr:expressed protein [Phakopsora pachyrhizi]